MDLKTVADTTNIQAYNDLLVKTTADCHGTYRTFLHWTGLQQKCPVAVKGRPGVAVKVF